MTRLFDDFYFARRVAFKLPVRLIDSVRLESCVRECNFLYRTAESVHVNINCCRRCDVNVTCSGQCVCKCNFPVTYSCHDRDHSKV